MDVDDFILNFGVEVFWTAEFYAHMGPLFSLSIYSVHLMGQGLFYKSRFLRCDLSIVIINTVSP